MKWGGAKGKDLAYEVISLEPYAGLELLFDRLDATRVPVVVVFVPREVAALRDLLGLRLLRRRGEALNREIYLVCEDLRTRQLAAREGLHAVRVAHQLPRAIRQAARRPGAPPLLVFPRRGLTAVLALVPAALIGLAVAGLIYFVVPGATVRLEPVSRAIEETFVVEATSEARDRPADRPADTGSAESSLNQPAESSPGPPDQAADRSADPDQAVPIPARVVVVNFPFSQQMEPTGHRIEPATAATGQVLLLNRTNEQQVVPRGAEVIQPGGPTFLIVAPVELPPVQWSAARVGIVAKDLGPAGNLPAQAIDRFQDAALNARVSVVNEQPTTGGQEADRTYVTSDDYVELRHRIENGLSGAAMDALHKARAPEESIYPETIHYQILDEAFSHEIGQTTSQAAITVTVATRAPAFEGRAVQQVAQRVLTDQAGSGAWALVPGTFETRPLEALSWDDARVRFRVLVRGTLRTAIDPPALERLIAGRSPEEAADLLHASLPLARRPEISLFPWWQTTVPTLGWRIRIEQ